MRLHCRSHPPNGHWEQFLGSLSHSFTHKHKKISKIRSYQTSVSSCIEYSPTSGSDFPVYTDTEARLIGSVSTLKPLLEKSVVFRDWKLSFGFSRHLYWDRSVSFHLETLYSLLRSSWPSAVGYGSVVPHRWVVCCSSWNPVISIATHLLPYPVPSCPSPPPLSPSFPPPPPHVSAGRHEHSNHTGSHHTWDVLLGYGCWIRVSTSCRSALGSWR